MTTLTRLTGLAVSQPTGAPRWLKGAFALLLAVVVALAALLIVEPRGHSADTQSLNTASTSGNASADSLAGARSAALQDAITEAPVLFSYDYRTLDKNLAAARAVTTGSFTTDYDKVSVPAVKPLAAKYQVVVTAKVLAASVVSDSNPQQIKVLLFLDQVVKNSQLAAPRLDANRTVLTMSPVGKGWKVSGVDAI